MLDAFSPAVREWFASSFPQPTEPQIQGWPHISAGEHTLICAPTGSGKTLTSFLASIDRLTTTPRPEARSHRTRVLYISPLRALAFDIEKNLRAPLKGIGFAAERLGEGFVAPEVGMRTGDTPSNDRQKLVRRPPDLLITTPESLYLMLTSKAAETLVGVETVIIDEIHAMATTKRGAHLALTLERLEEVTESPPQRIGLSATQRPLEEIAEFLGGYSTPGSDGQAGTKRPVRIVDAGIRKDMEIEVVIPIEDMSQLGQVSTELTSGPATAAMTERRTSIWPSIYPEILTRILANRSTIIFCNARRAAERLAAKLNELAVDEGVEGVVDPETGAMVDELVKAHHGSLAREQRVVIEDQLKRGELRAIVATSSLELGIDMGAVDLVIQVESPGAVSRGMQRIGRAGHQVGEPSGGSIFPKHRGDLLETAVVARRMLDGQIESSRFLRNPLDVLAQQIVAHVAAVEECSVDEVRTIVRRCANFAEISDELLGNVLDLLSGRYPSEEFSELRPRIVWDRVNDTVRARDGSKRLAVTSGGTIPDRGLFGVFLPDGTRVGELDEEMVYESRPGETFVLGASTWRIEDITFERVTVSPAPGQPGKMPFWHGDRPGRPLELGRALGAFVREIRDLSTSDPDRATGRAGGATGDGEEGSDGDEIEPAVRPVSAVARDRLMQHYSLDAFAATNLVRYLDEQAEATGSVPDDRTVVIERFRDEIGDWRVCILTPFGTPVHAPWAMAIERRLMDTFDLPVETMWGDDGIVIRLPESADELPIESLMIDPEDIDELVVSTLPQTALFSARFRECAGRALLLPRRRPDRRTPLWQQRQRAADLLAVASKFPTFPILLEASRECLQDVFDVPALREVLGQLRSRSVRVVTVDTGTASPMASSLLFNWIAAYMYEGDAPLAERRAAALALDRDLLRDLLGSEELRDLLDPEVLADVELELQCLIGHRRARSADELHDVLRKVGDLSAAEVDLRCTDDVDEVRPSSAASIAALDDRGDAATDGWVDVTDERDVTDAIDEPDLAGEPDATDDPGPGEPRSARSGAGLGRVWIDELVEAKRAIEIGVGGEMRYVAAEDAARYRDAFGCAIPVGLPTAFTDPVARPLEELVGRYARTHGPFVTADVAARFGAPPERIAGALAALEGEERLVVGEFRPEGVSREYVDVDVLRQLRRRSLAALRREVEPVDQAALGRFLPSWHDIPAQRGGMEALVESLGVLSGSALVASTIEADVLPSRVRGFRPSMLDELCTAGEVVWIGAGAIGSGDGRVRLTFADQLPLLAPGWEERERPDGALHDALRLQLAERGASFWNQLRSAAPGSTDDEILAALWDLVWAGEVTNDSLAPLRAVVGGAKVSSKTATKRTKRAGGRPRPGRLNRIGPPAGQGRWSLVAPLLEPAAHPTEASYAQALQLVERYGVVTREAVLAEGMVGGFANVYGVLKILEERGQVRRGYFVDGLGAAQFAVPGAVDRLRSARETPDPLLHPGDVPDPIVLATTDPANPYGGTLPWPDTSGRPARTASSVVVLRAGTPLVWFDRRSHHLVTFPGSTSDPSWAGALIDLVRGGRTGSVEVRKVDGDPLLGADVAEGLLDLLRAAGFVDGYRGLTYRT
ncbi:Lhr family helicase [Ilumatobacter sp.]|uniref:Lhr family helicase n=1 Tax=Ilumatobacter sp. TaxID=1967498 RepID=UPI003B5280B3